MTAPSAPAITPGRSKGARWRLGLHVALGVLTITLGLWAGLRWSLIATHVDARVVGTSWAEEGPDFKVLEFSGGRTLTIDTDLMTRLGDPVPSPGSQLQTDFGATVARLDDREVALRWSSTASRTTVVLAAIVVLSLVRRRRSRQPRIASGPPR